MPRVVILPSADLKRMIRARQRTGADRHDEVWNGVYFVSPIANNLHQKLVNGLTVFLNVFAGDPFLADVYPGLNVTNLPERWTKNYRCPDVGVFLPGNPAEDRGTHWLGGPDLAIEVVSPEDRSRAKLGFYASVGVRELLLIDRDPWALELFRLEDGVLQRAGRVTADSPEPLVCTVLPFSLRLRDSAPRPLIELQTLPPAEPRSMSI